MDASQTTTFEALPRLSQDNRTVTACKICAGRAPLFDVVDFNKLCSTNDPYAFGLAGVPIVYHRCDVCGFLFTRAFDRWSEADFARFVYNDDYVLVDGDYVEARPMACARMVAERLDAHHQTLRVLDYGGGRGLLAESLRAAGYDAASYDPFVDTERPTGPFDVITCFEVIEHSVDPVASMREMRALLADGGCIMLGTGVQPHDIATVRASWWYVGPRNGHVSIHTLESLALLGRTSDLTLHSSPNLFGFATGEPSPVSHAILEAIGPSYVTLDLYAPEPNEPAGPLRADPLAWHGVEGMAERFRWTTQRKVIWNWCAPPLGRSSVRFQIRLVNEIQPGFADRCRLSIGGEPVSLIRDGNILTAIVDLVLDGGVRIVLKTPPPLRPSDLSDSADQRLLGIAVSTRR